MAIWPSNNGPTRMIHDDSPIHFAAFPSNFRYQSHVFALPPQWDCRGCPGFRDPSTPSMKISQVYGGWMLGIIW